MVYTGFNGTAYINGTDVTVTIRGSGVDLMAEGKGRALLAEIGNESDMLAEVDHSMLA